MDNDLVFGQGKCEKHGTTWQVLNHGLAGYAGCVVCNAENFIEKTKTEMKENFLKQIKAIEWALLPPEQWDSYDKELAEQHRETLQEILKGLKDEFIS